jgi:hypothetical protein
MVLLLKSTPSLHETAFNSSTADQLPAKDILQRRKNREWEKFRMAEDKDKKDQPKEDIILIAEVRAHLHDGETIDLLPSTHEEDVRTEVNQFIDDWSKTGFLLKENFLYPWHRVKVVEVMSVQAMTHAQAAPYIDQWNQDTEAQKAFWKTRKPQAKKEEKTESAPPH